MWPKETNRLVLDTNILLDILVFEDPSTIELKQALLSRRLAAWTRKEILEEFQEVIARPLFKLDPPTQENLIRKAQELHHHIDSSELPPAPFKCEDQDDQVFLDLALKLAPCLLISKDNAVLKLKSKAHSYGVFILRSYSS